jgi:uncharacterized delta-60 repeat protein
LPPTTTTTTTFPLPSGFNDFLYAGIETADGDYMFGGNFTQYDSNSANRIVKLNPNGSIDGTFNYGTGFNNIVYNVTETSSGKFLVIGNFTSYNGTSVNRIVMLNADGSIDGTFNVGTGFNFFAFHSIETSDGGFLIGGNFTSYNGTSINRIVKLTSTGSIDGTFSVGTGFNNIVYQFIEPVANKYVLVGQFSSYNGTSAPNIVQLNSNGSIDGTFVYGTGFGNEVVNILLTPDNKYLVSGNFTQYNGTSSVNRILKLNTDGTIDGTFSSGTGFNFPPYAMTYTSDGGILVGGNFTDYNGTAANRIIKLTSTGGVDGTFVYGSGFNNFPYYATFETSDNKYLVGGRFTTYKGSTYNYVIKLEPNGTPIW